MRPAGFVLFCACWQPPSLGEPAKQPADLLADRPYLLHTPAEVLDGGALPAPPDGGWPLLLILHAHGKSGPETQRYLHLDTDDVRSRYFILTPVGRLFENSFNWHPNANDQSKYPWDSAWLRAVLLDVLAKAPINPARVAVIGSSQGAEMANRLACDSADLIASVVSVAGQLDVCEATRPVSALEIHGTNDEVLSYQSGVAAIDLWAKADGCTGPLVSTGATKTLVVGGQGGETSAFEYQGCPAGTTVAFWKGTGVDHVPERNDEFAAAVLKFIDDHPRR
jgi:polyhydroxybutyrate depolymerase